jgi:hypothetical protein
VTTARRKCIAWVGLLATAAAVNDCSRRRDETIASLARFREEYDAQRYDEIYDSASEELRAGSPRERFDLLMGGIHKRLGTVLRAEQTAGHVSYYLSSLRVTKSYDTTFEHGSAKENFVWLVIGGDAFLVSYGIDSKELKGLVKGAGSVTSAGPSPDATTEPAPEGCHWKLIAEVHALLAVPDGWIFRSLPGRDVLTYEVVPAGSRFRTKPLSRYRLEIRRHSPVVDVVARAKTFVEQFRLGGTTSKALEEQRKGVMSLFASVIEVPPRRVGESHLSVAVSAVANSRTGTLYTAVLAIPSDERPVVADLANVLFQRVRLDDAY